MFDFEKKSISRQPLLDWKDDQRRNRLKRDKVAGPSIFIAKAYEILEVISIPFSLIHTLKSSPGTNKEPASLFLMLIGSNKKFFPYTLDIVISAHL